MRAVVVVGTNYGDEGKGLATDYITHICVKKNEKILNVLHNGGAQRAHTVELPNGTRHVFRHLGSGSFAGADTYITGEFLVNPIMLREEMKELAALDCKPKVYIDDALRITTPWDMMANQILEENKSFDKRGGTCGMGIWETCLRSKYIRFTIQDLLIAMNQQKVQPEDYMRRIFKRIKEYYKKDRLKDASISEECMKVFDSEEMESHYIDDVFWMLMEPQIYYTPSLFLEKPQKTWAPYKNYDRVIFENGQGLLLDGDIKEYKDFNTPSRTTLDNPVSICKKWYYQTYTVTEVMSVVYVTRTYLTRHGIGPFPDELDVSYLEQGKRIFDKTNIPNDWQGSLRYAPFRFHSSKDPALSFEARIENSMHDVDWDSYAIESVSSYLFITHADELPPQPTRFMPLVPHGTYDDKTYFPCESGMYISYGPRRTDVRYYPNWEEMTKKK